MPSSSAIPSSSAPSSSASAAVAARHKSGTPKPRGLMVNAQGAKDEDNVWGKKSEWVDYSGETNGEKIGIAMFDNPKNPGFPNRWHTRG